MSKCQRALVSVYDKDGVVELAQALAEMKIDILSTGGTARLLRKNKVPLREVSEVTEFPEMLSGRVKTLHPFVGGARHRAHRPGGGEPLPVCADGGEGGGDAGGTGGGDRYRRANHDPGGGEELYRRRGGGVAGRLSESGGGAAGWRGRRSR
jgi:hypothetical protein